MIFNEMYSIYYKTVAKILGKAIDHPISKNEIYETVKENAFDESILTIEPALDNEQWQLICNDKKAVIKHTPTLPLTTLQKRWLRAISCDPRIKLFTDEIFFPDAEPLFTPDDFTVFDKYSDGDHYTDENYIRNFRTILDALKNKYPLKIKLISLRNIESEIVILPSFLEYSEKDDRFRMIGSGCKTYRTVNVGTIISCSRYTEDFQPEDDDIFTPKQHTVKFELTDERKALERILLHFAHFEKTVDKIDDMHYMVTLSYLNSDETEVLIRILSFGPMLRVIEPDSFIDLIKERLIKQKRCGL